jgi:anhydro-N-acetylmuramic acid kinase
MVKGLMKEKYLGLMTGTSLDGVDIAVCAIDDQYCTLEVYESIAFDKELKDEVLRLIDGNVSLKDVGEVDCKLALFFARCINLFLDKYKYSKATISAIGLHGQTVWHEPNSKTPFSMQLANPSVLAMETGIDVVADFRSKDIALGGQGAPFAPVFHNFLFSKIEDCVVLNIGGMANISVLGQEVIGYDTGCGNVLMDLWIQEHQGLAYDQDGAWARTGKVHEALLANFLKDDYFLLNFPKSTGREYFNKKFLINYLEPFDTISNEDVQATLLALTVVSIANELKKFKVRELLVCGGGVRNSFLMEKLDKTLADILVHSTEQYAVNADSIEAMIFAWLARKRLYREEVDLKCVTGAKKNTVLGAIYAGN